MDSTLQQILAALYQAHATIDQLQRRVAELEAERSAPKHEEAVQCPPSS